MSTCFCASAASSESLKAYKYQHNNLGTCMPLYFRFPENGVLMLKHVGIILYVMYDF